MTLVYGLAIAIGAGGVLYAVGSALNPDRIPLRATARFGLVGMLGFGLGGMSASFGGWNSGLAFLAGLGGAALVVAMAIRFGDVEQQ